MSSPLPPGSSRALLALLLLGLASPLATDAASRTGAVEFTDVAASGRSVWVSESAILRSGPESASQILTRTGVYLFVTESEGVWNDYVADNLAEALEDGPQAVARVANGLPADIAQAGPDLAGGLVQVQLPKERGEAVLAIYFPDLLDRSGRGLDRLNAAVPNEGLYVSGVTVKEDPDGESGFTSLYLPARPKGLTRGRVPDVNLRELPDGGAGDLAIFRGKGAPGSSGDKYREEVQRLSGAESLSASSLRDFPKGEDDLVRALRSSRAEQEELIVDGPLYRVLGMGPESWDTETRKSAHPTRYITFSAPVAIGNDEGERVGTVVLGGVAFYTPLMLSAEEARRYVNKSPYAFYGSIHRGELPFFREDGELWFFLGHLDSWREGKRRQRRGRAWQPRAVADRIKEMSKLSGSRRVLKAVGQPLPTRFEPIPEAELGDRPDDRPPVRGRVYDDDLAGWVRHWDRKVEFEGSRRIIHATKTTSVGASFQASFDITGAPVVEPTGTGPLLELVDVYPVKPQCAPGEKVQAVIEFVVDRIPGGEEATLSLEWSMSSGGPALARLSATLLREAGEHELIVEAGCPSNADSGELGVILTWPDTALSVTGEARVAVRP